MEDEREAAWAALMAAAERLVRADRDATQFGRRGPWGIVAIWPDDHHDLDHWPPRSVIRLED